MIASWVGWTSLQTCHSRATVPACLSFVARVDGELTSPIKLNRLRSPRGRWVLCLSLGANEKAYCPGTSSEVCLMHNYKEAYKDLQINHKVRA